MQDKEIWKDVPGYEGYYKSSSLGRIKSVDRLIVNLNGIKLKFKGKLLKFSQNNRGYLICNLWKHNNKRMFLIHRLVAICHIPNPENKPEINHKDGNKLNNHIDNLEWCTRSENNKHAISTGLRHPANKGIVGLGNPTNKIIYKLDLEGNIIDEYFALTEAANKNGISKSHISSCCNGRYNTAGGYKWKYKTYF